MIAYFSQIFVHIRHGEGVGDACQYDNPNWCVVPSKCLYVQAKYSLQLCLVVEPDNAAWKNQH